MPKDLEEKVACRTPAAAGVTNIPAWKFNLLRDAISKVLAAAGPEGMLNKDLRGAVAQDIAAADLERLGKLGWHVVTVKLELEVRGEVQRLPVKGPMRIALSGAE